MCEAERGGEREREGRPEKGRERGVQGDSEWQDTQLSTRANRKRVIAQLFSGKFPSTSFVRTGVPRP